MVWTPPMTFVDGVPLTAAQLNTYLRDNMLETEAAKATTLGGLFIASGPNAIVERYGGSDYVDQADFTTSTTYTDLTNIGPQVTAVTGSRAFYFMSCEISNKVVNNVSVMSLAISGATTKAAADSGALQMDGILADNAMRVGICGFFEDLTPGTNTFTCKYKTPAGNEASFSDRSLTIIPF